MKKKKTREEWRAEINRMLFEEQPEEIPRVYVILRTYAAIKVWFRRLNLSPFIPSGSPRWMG